MLNKRIVLRYEVVVIGGGMAGVCAALAAARSGSSTVLIQDRPVLGGNASAEIGVKIQGADELGHYRFSRETGILNELFERNIKFPNPFQSSSIWSLVLWDICREQDNLDVYLNTIAINPQVDNGKIICIEAEQSTTVKKLKVYGNIFIDCSGDGRIAAESGAPFMSGREDNTAFGESLAEPESDNCLMGSTISLKVRDAEKPIPFDPPGWVHVFEEDKDFPGALSDCPHGLSPLLSSSGGYWWIEYGGELDPFADAEIIRDELYSYALGVWDHIKNRGDHGAENLVLDSIGWVPGRRDSRRFIGDYVLCQDDLESCRVFPDAIAYGGWHIDLHNPKGITGAPERYWKGRLLPGRYTIPYRCLYSKTIANLMFAGRNISASHVAFGSIRVMATCALLGQAAGNAASMCVSEKCLPRDIGKDYIETLQQRLLTQDCYIPDGVRKNNKASSSVITASSEARLNFPKRDSWYEISQKIAQSFVASREQLESITIPLRNSTDKIISVTLHLRRARRIDDFTNDQNIISVTNAIPTGEHDILFSLPECKLEPETVYWICLKCESDGLACGYSAIEVPATQAGKFEHQVFEDDIWFMRRIRGSFSINLLPEMNCYSPQEVVTGINRPDTRSNLWISKPGLPQHLAFSWHKSVLISEIELVFDNNIDQTWAQWSEGETPECLVRDFSVYVLADNQKKLLYEVKGNVNRIVKRKFELIEITNIIVEINKTWGSSQTRIIELRCF